jgi:sigma-E factor negative regulatory protein RseC
VHEQIATVLRSTPEALEVEARARSACGHCASASHCGTGLLASLLGDRPRRLRLAPDAGIAPGEQVVIGLSDPLLLRAAALAYLMPLGTLLMPALLVDALGLGNLAAGLAGFTGLLVGLAALAVFTRRADGRYRPKLLRRREGVCTPPSSMPSGVEA